MFSIGSKYAICDVAQSYSKVVGHCDLVNVNSNNLFQQLNMKDNIKLNVETELIIDSNVTYNVRVLFSFHVMDMELHRILKTGGTELYLLGIISKQI